MKINLSKKEFELLQTELGTDAEISRHLKVSRQAIWKFRKRMKIKRRSFIRDQIIVNSYNNGIPVTKISAKAKLSIPQVYRIIKNGKKPQMELPL